MAKRKRETFASGRPKGHVQAHEIVSDWEQFWVVAYSSEGFGYRQIAALVYGLSELRVTDEERNRVGRIARTAGCGCNSYRTMRGEEAWARLQDLHVAERHAKPPLLTRLKHSLQVESKRKKRK